MSESRKVMGLRVPGLWVPGPGEASLHFTRIYPYPLILGYHFLNPSIVSHLSRQVCRTTLCSTDDGQGFE